MFVLLVLRCRFGCRDRFGDWFRFRFFGGWNGYFIVYELGFLYIEFGKGRCVEYERYVIVVVRFDNFGFFFGFFSNLFSRYLNSGREILSWYDGYGYGVFGRIYGVLVCGCF